MRLLWFIYFWLVGSNHTTSGFNLVHAGEVRVAVAVSLNGFGQPD